MVIVISRRIILCDTNQFGGRKRVGKNEGQCSSGYKYILSPYKKRSYMIGHCAKGSLINRKEEDKTKYGWDSSPECVREASVSEIYQRGVILDIDNFKADKLNDERAQPHNTIWN
jgi:hypothetical protein